MKFTKTLSNCCLKISFEINYSKQQRKPKISITKIINYNQKSEKECFGLFVSSNQKLFINNKKKFI